MQFCSQVVGLFTQSDSLAMVMYTIGTLPLITDVLRQYWYANDSAVGDKIYELKQWWDLLVQNNGC